MSYVRAFAPGRTEIAGNHTDHQGGRAIAATVDCGIEMHLRATGGDRVRLDSEGFAPVEFAVDEVAPCGAERFTTAALAKGVVCGLRAAGVPVGGFEAQVQSDIPSGGGLSSSAAFELALAQGLSLLFAGRRIAPEPLARIGQAAERDWFGKPCGLLDQLAIAHGGINLLDFAQDPPTAERIDFDFERAELALFLIDAHCDHSRYTAEYAQVARDMDDAARYLGARALSQVTFQALLRRFSDVRRDLGDLLALRALHYFYEMKLVEARAAALRAGDAVAFLAATRRSGASSAQYLQNVSTGDRAEQPAMVALALADALLSGAGAGAGAARIHGGGFGGTIQAFVTLEDAEAFASAIDAQLGAGSCKRYRVTDRAASAERAE